MSRWLLRGLAFAALMVIVRLVQGALITSMGGEAVWASVILVSLFGVVALLWGLADGRGDARTNPDPDRRGDWAMIWLLAGLVAGVLSGFVSWFISQFYNSLYAEGLLGEVTTFASFTALLTFVLGMAGVAIGRALVDRNAPPVARHGHDDERADTDVFEAVRDDRGQDGSQTAPVSTTTSTETAPTRVEERP